MGTTVLTIDPADTTLDTIRAELTQAPTPTRTGFDFVYLTMHGSTAYGVMKITPPAQPPRWTGLVIKTSRKTNPAGFVELAYKEIDETMQPYFYDAPPKMLDMLDRLAFYDNDDAMDNAKQWRADCRRHHADRKAARAAVQPGQLIEIRGTRYRVEHKQPGRLGYTVSHADSGMRYRLPLNQIKHAKKVTA